MKNPVLCFHYDIARGTYLLPEIFCEALRLAARSGYTHFLPYLENMIRLPSIERACPSCAYTPEEWGRFEAVAEEVGIELVPHFNVIGHAERIAPAYPELCGAGAAGASLEIDVTKLEAKEWMRRCLGEFCGFSRGRYFLIGGDEWQPPAFLLDRPDVDVASVWVGWINAAIEYLVERGRQPIVWHDMLIHYPQTQALLSKHAVIAFWFYDRDSDYAALATFKDLGFRTLMATSVFENGLPLVGQRVLEALGCATAATKRHACDGTMVTSWETCRWEYLSYAIPAAAEVLGGKELPTEIIEASTLFATWTKLPSDSALAAQWKSRVEILLDSPAWAAAPELRRLLRAKLVGDEADDRASYAQYHYCEGDGYENLLNPPPQLPWPTNFTISEMPEPSSFGIYVTHDAERGDMLRFCNGDESFVVYPKFGASLQQWQRSGNILIPSGISDFLKNPRRPGGYRSYSAVGGFRVIWALGTHSNPCILWQYPWEWSVEEQADGPSQATLRLVLPHGIFRIVIAMERGVPGFSYEVRCINQLDTTFGAFNFNLPLAFGADDPNDMKLSWSEDRSLRECTIASVARSGFWIPASGSLTIHHPRRPLRIEASLRETAGYFVDWGRGFMTPDLRGRYRKLVAGEETVARWSFR